LRGIPVGFPAGARRFSLLSSALTGSGAHPTSYITSKHEVLVGTNRLISSDTTRTAQKTTHPSILRCRWNMSTGRCLVTVGGYAVQSNKLLLALDSTAIFGSESHGTDVHILLPDGSGSSPCRTVHIPKLGTHSQTHRLSLIKHEMYIKEASLNSYIAMCIRCRGNVVTEPLRSNDMRIHLVTHRLMGGIYEVRS
jgi:hypothetical protein